ncbi:cytochrome P450 [Nocardioides humilatus]|uniref:Cytochrome P450 n=1 Tax=Nocardioides humilatus TaxID=2607660 RepID=A0A5B1LKC4_9ACTN|nr:cytochrome P450 [Nocardioides humilatus]KAA1421195.1 cytochrome P450 [Nocardioides humilatus]
MAREAPTHPGSFLLGSARELLANQVEFFESTHAGGDDLVRVLLGPPGLRRSLYLSHTPAGAETLLSARTMGAFRKENPLYGEVRMILGDGILTAQDDDWVRQKRFIQPIFTKARVDGYLESMLEAITATTAEMGAGGTVDLGDQMMRMTLRIVGRVLLGDDTAELEEAVHEHFPVASQGMLTRALFPMRMPLSWPLPVNRRTARAQRALFEVCDRLIARRRAGESDGDDLARLLVDARDGQDRLTDEEVRDQVLIFLLAGHETTSTSLTFALHLLGCHPDVQERLRQEALSVFGDGVPTAAQVHGELPWTTAVLKESMRLYPATPFNGRLCVEDTEVDGCVVPAGSDLLVSVWNIHRRPDLYPDPERFDPSRFLPENDKDRGRYDWLPFGAGPRACIGQHFSILESVAALAVMVRDLEFRAPEGTSERVPVGSALTLHPLAPVLSEVSSRPR